MPITLVTPAITVRPSTFTNPSMGQAQRLEILLADKQQRGIVHGGARSGIRAAIEYRDLRHRTTGAVDGEHLLAASSGGLEDANVPMLDDVQTGARLSFAENHFARRVTAGHNALDQVTQFGIGESGENLHLCQGLSAIRTGFRHGAHYRS